MVVNLWASVVRAVPQGDAGAAGLPRASTATRSPCSASTTRTSQPAAALELARRERRHLPAARRPRRRPERAGPAAGDPRPAVPALRRRRRRGHHERPAASTRPTSWSSSSTSTSGPTCDPRLAGAGPGRRGGDHGPRPDPVHPAARRRRPGAGAVLMLFGEGPQGRDLLLTERAHDMRSHPGQVSFPGGSVDPGETAGRGRAARGARRRPALDPAGVEVFAGCPSCGCRRATSR